MSRCAFPVPWRTPPRSGHPRGLKKLDDVGERFEKGSCASNYRERNRTGNKLADTALSPARPTSPHPSPPPFSPTAPPSPILDCLPSPRSSFPPPLQHNRDPPSPPPRPSHLAPSYPSNPAGPAASKTFLFECPHEGCGKSYRGKNARSVWRRHLQDKHGIPLKEQPRRTRWDRGALSFCAGYLWGKVEGMDGK